MAIFWHCTTILPYKSNLPEDVSENTWAFRSTGDPGADLPVIGAALIDFFNTDHAATTTPPICTFMSQWIQRDACQVRIAPVDTATAKETAAPIFVPWTLGATTNTLHLPLEVAVCNSVRSGGSTVKGRQYVGPLNGSALGGTAGSVAPRVASQFQVQLAASSETLRGLPSTIEWCIWSRKNSALFEVTSGYIDDAFDTQRRRGNDPTSRLVWPTIIP